MLTTGQRSAIELGVSFPLAFSRLSQRNGQSPSESELPMTRTDIGDFLGLTIETASRTLSKLKMMGLIELPRSNRVMLVVDRRPIRTHLKPAPAPSLPAVRSAARLQS